MRKNIWMLVLLTVTSCILTLAQETNAPPMYDPVLFPHGNDAIWAALIPPITFGITWAIGKIPPLPKDILPWLTPVAGILIGLVMDWVNKVNIGWISSGALGTIAVFAYEAIRGLTKAGSESALTPTPKPPEPREPPRI